MSPLEDAALVLSNLLRTRGDSLVLAESCTGGLAAAALVRLPGASSLLAGSFVTYQTESKAAWLGISRETLDRFTPVSPEVAAAMAAGALVRTPHASVAVAITGHLGPDAPAGENGRLVVGLRRPGSSASTIELRLPDDLEDRPQRQEAAATRLLAVVASALADNEQ